MHAVLLPGIASPDRSQVTGYAMAAKRHARPPCAAPYGVFDVYIVAYFYAQHSMRGYNLPKNFAHLPAQLPLEATGGPVRGLADRGLDRHHSMGYDRTAPLHARRL